MNTVKFAEEFTQLISRWRRYPVSSKDGADNLAPLTKPQLLNTIKSVLEEMLGIELCEISEAGIAASTPSLSAAQKIKQEQTIKHSKSFRFGSVDDLLRSSDSKSQEEMQIEKHNTPEFLAADKFISRSNPTMHVTFADKPDASIRAQAERGVLRNVTEQQGDKVKSHLILNKIEVLRNCATDVVAKIDELKKEMCPQAAKPIRRLSSIAGSPGVSGSSSLLRKVPPRNLRRSSTGFPGTSATQKLNRTNTIEKEKATARRQTIAHGSIHVKPSTISPRSRSPLVAGSTTKKAPQSTLKAAKNPKSARIQSTIPKSHPPEKLQ